MKVHLAAGVRRTELTCLSLSLILALIAVECGCSWEKPGWAKRLSEVETRQGMQGEWRPVYAEENGKEVDKPTVMREQRRVIIDGNSLLMERFKDGVAGVYYGLFEISPETNAFDWMGTDPQGTAVKWIGRYELDDDELKLCFHCNPNGSAVRPKDFSTADAQGSSKTVLYVLKRHGSATAGEKRSLEPAVISVVPPLDRKEPVPSVSSSDGQTATGSGDSLPTRIAEAASGLAASQKSESTDPKVSLVPDLQKKAAEAGADGRSDQEEGSSSVVNKTTGRPLMASRVFYDEQKNSLRLEYDFRNPEQLRDFTFDERAVTSVSAGVRIGGAEKMMHTVPFSDGLLKAVLVLGTKEREQAIVGVSDRCTLRFDGVSQGANSYCLLKLFSDERELASRNCDFFANEYGVEYFVSPRKVKAVVNGQELAKERNPAGSHIGHFRIHGGNGGVTVKSLKIEGTPQKGWLEREAKSSSHEAKSATALPAPAQRGLSGWANYTAEQKVRFPEPGLYRTQYNNNFAVVFTCDEDRVRILRMGTNGIEDPVLTQPSITAVPKDDHVAVTFVWPNGNWFEEWRVASTRINVRHWASDQPLSGPHSQFGEARPTEDIDTVVGRWKWWNGSVHEMHADGTIKDHPRASWRKAGMFGRQFIFTWQGGRWTDTLTLSEDGLSLSGTNNEGGRISATRIQW